MIYIADIISRRGDADDSSSVAIHSVSCTTIVTGVLAYEGTNLCLTSLHIICNKRDMYGLDLGRDHTAAIQGYGCTVHVGTRPTTQEQACTCDILWGSNPAQWDSRLDRVAE